MTPTAQQLILDLNLLLRKIYPTKKAVAEEMARQLQREPDSFYGFFVRNTSSPEGVTKRFMYKFYKVFQADLDTIKRDEDFRGATNNESLKKQNEDLHNSLYKVIENVTVLVVTNQKLVEAQIELIARLKGS